MKHRVQGHEKNMNNNRFGASERYRVSAPGSNNRGMVLLRQRGSICKYNKISCVVKMVFRKRVEFSTILMCYWKETTMITTTTVCGSGSPKTGTPIMRGKHGRAR